MRAEVLAADRSHNGPGMAGIFSDLQNGGIYSVVVPAMEAGSSAGGGRAGRGGAVAASTSPNAAPRQIPFTVRMEIDLVAERKQVFEEAWRTMKNRFYDGKMHGVNWAAAKDTYETLLPDIADTDELHNVVMQMIGELNASHTGISGGGVIPGQPGRSVCRRFIPDSIWIRTPRDIIRSVTSIEKVRRITIM